jgi:hypothetical protein
MACFAAGCGPAAEDRTDTAVEVEAAQNSDSAQSLEALDRAAAVQQTLDEAEQKRRKAIEEQGD